MLQAKKLTIAAGQATAATVKAIAAAPDQTLFIGRLAGIATGIKTGTSQYGEWTALVGDFVKTSPGGELNRAPMAFGPDMVIMPVQSALAMGTGAVNVAVDVYAVLDDKSPVGFSYRTKSVIPDNEDSPMARLLALTGANPIPQLAAPTAKGAKAK